ncbi:hypothetical protein vseg_021460 [Gypsophila vaccaria]
MGYNKTNLPTTYSNYYASSKHRLLILTLISIFLPLILLCSIFPHTQLADVTRLQSTRLSTSFPPSNKAKPPKWLEAIRGAHLTHQRPLKVGLVNFEGTEQSHLPTGGIAKYINITLEPVSRNVTWNKLFPEWINESPSDKCPPIPMPSPRKYLGLDVIVTKLPCGEHPYDLRSREREGIRDVHRLQISLAMARLIVVNSIGKNEDVYGVFIAKCEPMLEIFKCDDLLWHGGSYWVYKPNVQNLRELINMPLGTCELAHPHNKGLGTRQLQEKQMTLPNIQQTRAPRPNTLRREAYVTVLHSSEFYVCGAIALARSILQTNTTKDLVLLADHSISDHSIKGLQSAGWKTKRIRRIRSPKADSSAYNKWNYSKLRVWQLTEYDKVIFIDSDFIVLHNIDHFFDYPQFSAGPNDKWLFNSGIMVLEPSQCFFKTLMSKRHTMKSYNGGDQGYLNEVLTWWHRLTRKLTFIKFYAHEDGNRSVPLDRHTIHYLGFKPWLCYRDYDCNWDRLDHHQFASDDVHARWWKVYDTLPKELQRYCRLTKQLKNVLYTTRVEAQKVNLHDEHWKIKIKDPRQHTLHD